MGILLEIIMYKLWLGIPQFWILEEREKYAVEKKELTPENKLNI